MKRFILFIVNFVKHIQKLRQRYKLMIKIKNILIKILSIAATGYSIFAMVEPFLSKDKKEDVVEIDTQ
jgi:hypothetical protein